MISGRHLIWAFAAVTAILLSSSCIKETEMDPAMLESGQISLKVRGKTVFIYDEDDHQVSSNIHKLEFRVGSDDMTEYFIIHLDAFPAAVDQDVSADIRYVTGRGASRKRDGLSMKVVKTDDTGLVWLWCSRDRTGAVIRILN